MKPAQRTLLALLLIVAFGLVLRMWGIGFGLPFSYANDEYHEVLRALQLGSGGFNLERTGKGGFYYLLFVEYGIYFVWLKLMGVVNSAADFARYFVRDPSAFYYMGRASAAILGALTIALTFAVTRRAFSVGGAILAAVFLCVNQLHIDLSHRIGVDIPLACLVAATLIYAVRLAVDGTARDYIWAALFAALATTTKLPGAVLLLPLLTAHFYYVRRMGGGVREGMLSKHMWSGAALFAVVLIASNPGILFDGDLLSPLTGGYEETSMDGDGFEAADGSPARPSLFLFYLNVLLQSMGWPLFLISMAGLVYGIWKRTAGDVILVPFALVFYLIISSATSEFLYYPRYTLPIVVVLSVLAGRMLFELWQRYRLPNPVVALLLVAASIATPLIASVKHDHLLTQTDTRTLAKDWIEQHVPAGSKILIEGLKIKPVKGTAQLQDSAANLRRRIAYWRKVEPKQAKYLQIELQVLSGTTYELELITLDDVQSLKFYEDRGVEYFVVRPEMFLESRRRQPGSRRLVEALRSDPQVVKLNEFREEPDRRPGPAIEIYKLVRSTGDRS